MTKMFENINSTEINDDVIIRYYENYVNEVIGQKNSTAGDEDLISLLTEAVNIIDLLVQHCFDYGIGIPNQQISNAIRVKKYKSFNEGDDNE